MINTILKSSEDLRRAVLKIRKRDGMIGDFVVMCLLEVLGVPADMRIEDEGRKAC